MTSYHWASLDAGKKVWRQKAAEIRSDLEIDHPRHLAPLAEFLQSNARQPGWVVGFRAMAGEVDLASLMSRTELGPFALTRTPDSSMDLTVHPADSPTELHRYGFEQPAARSPNIADADIAVVLVPGLVFGHDGSRLGRGKGYYDRFLARLVASTASTPGPALVAITADVVTTSVPTDSHDITMTHLATSTGISPVEVR